LEIVFYPLKGGKGERFGKKSIEVERQDDKIKYDELLI
jgi:hypothetical protein